MSRSTAGPAPAVQQSREANSSWEGILLEFQERYQEASQMHQFRYPIGRKHQHQRYVQVYEDQGYVRWVKAHVQKEGATREQLRFLHYIQLQENETGAAAEPAPGAPVEDPADEEDDFIELEAEAVTVVQLAARLGRAEQVLQQLMERLRIS